MSPVSREYKKWASESTRGPTKLVKRIVPKDELQSVYGGIENMLGLRFNDVRNKKAKGCDSNSQLGNMLCL